MLQTSSLLAVLAVAFAAPVPDDTAPAARKTVDQAVKALGGADKLAKLPATTFKFKATTTEGPGGTFEGNWSIQYPDKYRAELTRTGPDGRAEAATLVFTGDKAWAFEAAKNRTEDAPPEAIGVLKPVFSALHLAHRPVGLTEKGYELAPLGEVKIDGKAAIGVKVTRKEQADLDLYFDKDTHLPVKAEVAVMNPNPQAEAKEMKLAFLFHDYKEADGVKHFTKVVVQMEGKEMATMELSEVKRLDKLDAKLFDKP